MFYEEISNAGTKNGQGQRVMEKLAILKKRAAEELIDNPELLHVGDKDDSGSESEPELG